MPTRILIIDSDVTASGYLARALSDAGYSVTVAATGREGLAAAWSAAGLGGAGVPSLVVLAPELSDVNGLNIARRLRVDARTRGVRVFMVSARTEPQDILAGALAGADGYFTRKPGVEREITARIREVLPPNGPRPMTSSAPLVAVVGAAGGVGTTSLLANLAHVLGERLAVLGADLAQPLGALADVVGAPAVGGNWTEAAQARREHVNACLIRPEAWSFDLLRGLERPFTVQGLRPERATELLRELQSTYNVLLTDLGRGLEPVAEQVMAQAGLVLVVIGADPAQLPVARRLLDHWAGRGVDADRLALVLNHAHGADGLSLHQVEADLGVVALAEIPHGRLLAANRTHQPVEVCYPRDPAAAVIRDLAACVAQHLGVMDLDREPSMSVVRDGGRRARPL
jgi:CheY-like chemotaxis protein